ncbi:FAD-binding oxidoreductase [Komagataeibacter sp. FNDCF1]|uniref:NAD(P)/FAD-dependent oxidoreductase n=1 Tax=Komagataeibacter sp. FNDCF1 TaxID=2878681 RepID=UPI002104BF07|nr:FAD-dependent oxidoreductase [Komagataeibacter sp. FNDCF1]MCE2563212.1 FAD-binding oxidoreductase [Komagataeibacter sp. FNDCF1]
MAKSALVLGGGMVGVCTAWHLARRGFDVTVVDRRAPGQETSYGNAGLIQRECVEPYNFPHDFSRLLGIALGRDNTVHYDMRAMPGLASRLWQYWRQSGPKSYPAVVRNFEAMIRHCLTEHEVMIRAAGAQDLIRPGGFKLALQSPRAFAHEARRAEFLQQEFGVGSTIMDSDMLARAEPALRERFAGAIHWTDAWAVRDPGGLVSRYADALQQAGGRLATGDAATLEADGTGWRVSTTQGPIRAEHAVVALGPWSGRLLRGMGYRYPLFVKRGYHTHYAGDAGLSTAVLDMKAGTMMVPMNMGLRVTTGVEFAALDAPPTPVQMRRSERRARQLLSLGARIEPTPWLGNRPALPDMVPVVGAAPRHRGLWLHFGHAHQGFTLGPVTGRLLAEMMNGETPYFDPQPYSPARFG